MTQKEPGKDLLDLIGGLTEEELSLTPMCRVCGWRKGGLHSWDGKACKCGHTSPTFKVLFQQSP